MDRILLHLAFSALRTGGHRHGTFLSAAATAAKCAVYVTYIEQDRNLRRTGQLHHIEPKRVKAIVEEIEQSLAEGRVLKMLGAQSPDYLIQFPCLWLERYPCRAGCPRWQGGGLSARQRWEIEQKLPSHLPEAQVIDSMQLTELIDLLHERSQAKLPESERVPLSEALEEHITSRLLHSHTILKIENAWGLPLFALLKSSYAPEGLEERVFTSIEDTANYFRLMKEWANRSPHTMRIIEELDVPLESFDEALNELDVLVRSWADRHHQSGGKSVILQMAFGEK